MTAQTFTTLYNFTALNNNTNSDGALPFAGLILSGDTLYGTARDGGSLGAGTVFKVNTNGTGFTNLYGFTGGNDGDYPSGGVILSDNTLYGTTVQGGTSGGGTLFAINTNGTGFTNLHSFTASSDGAGLYAGLVLSSNTLYGAASNGGSSGGGTLFAINTDGTGFTNLHSFTASSDGAEPHAGLILSGNTLFGTAFLGGSSSNGTVFAIKTDGAGFTNLHSFTSDYPNYTNSDGVNPHGGLMLSNNILYGMAGSGGSLGFGTIFKVSTNGTEFTALHNFYYGADGGYPYAGLILSGSTLYGTAQIGGSSAKGTVFAVNTDGTGFTNLHSFRGYPSEGANSYARLVLSGNTLYGTTLHGGGSDNGTVFRLSLPPPPLTVIHSTTNVVLTWPTYAPEVTLQSNTNLVSLAVWSTVSPAPTIVNGKNAVTNPIVGTQKFYRLSQ